MTRVTRRQRELLQVISEFVQEYGYSPTVRELSKRMGLASPATVHGMLERLKEKGLITWEPSSPRTIKILDKKKSRLEYIPTVIDGKLIDVPLLSSLHLTVMDRIKTYGKVQDIPKDITKDEVKKVIEDLVEIGWVRTKKPSMQVKENEKAIF